MSLFLTPALWMKAVTHRNNRSARVTQSFTAKQSKQSSSTNTAKKKFGVRIKCMFPTNGLDEKKVIHKVSRHGGWMVKETCSCTRGPRLLSSLQARLKILRWMSFRIRRGPSTWPSDLWALSLVGDSYYAFLCDTSFALMMLYLARLQHLELHLSRLTTSAAYRRNSGQDRALTGSKQILGHEKSTLHAPGKQIFLCLNKTLRLKSGSWPGGLFSKYKRARALESDVQSARNVCSDAQWLLGRLTQHCQITN